MFTSLTPHPVIPGGAPELGGWARLWHQLGPGSRKRYAQARDEARQVAELRAEWEQACLHVGLGIMIYTPSGVAASVPRIARVDFGPPVSFTVELRPGQRVADVRDVAGRLALALGVAGLEVTRCTAGYATVVVVSPRFGYGAGDGGDGGPDDQPRRPDLRVA
jgi:hypothetical protein